MGECAHGLLENRNAGSSRKRTADGIPGTRVFATLCRVCVRRAIAAGFDHDRLPLPALQFPAAARSDAAGRGWRKAIFAMFFLLAGMGFSQDFVRVLRRRTGTEASGVYCRAVSAQCAWSAATPASIFFAPSISPRMAMPFRSWMIWRRSHSVCGRRKRDIAGFRATF